MKVLGAAVAAESGKKIVESTVDRAKKAARSKSGRAAIKKAVKTAAPIAATVARGGLATGAILYAGGKALTATRKRDAKRWADQQLKATRKKLPKLTADQARVLWNQYYEHALKQPVTNPYLGK